MFVWSIIKVRSDYELYDGCQDNVASSRYLTNVISPLLLLTPLNTNTHSAFLTGFDLNYIIETGNLKSI